MTGVGLWSPQALWRGRLYQGAWLHRAAHAMAPSGLIAVLAGWVATKVERQPSSVYGLLRTAESAAPLDAPAAGATLDAFLVIQFEAFGAGRFHILRLMSRSPLFEEPRLKDVTWGPIRTARFTPAPEQPFRRPQDL